MSDRLVIHQQRQGPFRVYAAMPKTKTNSAKTEQSPNKVASLILDPWGDVLFILPSQNGERTARFQVNSNSLCLASPVFRAMLGSNSHFKEATALEARAKNPASPPVEITLADDDPNALALVLRIIHHQNNSLPKTLSEDQLYEVAIICDKYDLRHALMLWLDQSFPPSIREDGIVKAYKGLFMAYAFARPELFRQLSKQLILTCRPDMPAELVIDVDTDCETDSESDNYFMGSRPGPMVVDLKRFLPGHILGMSNENLFSSHSELYYYVELIRRANSGRCDSGGI